MTHAYTRGVGVGQTGWHLPDQYLKEKTEEPNYLYNMLIFFSIVPSIVPQLSTK